MDEIQHRGLPLCNGAVYFCGTILLQESKFWYSDACRIQLSDSRTGKTIIHTYNVNLLKDDITYFNV